jgi:predicted metal-dependent hydrolase
MTDQLTRSVPYGSRTLTYALAYAARKSLAITVDPTGLISVTAPVGSRPAEVDYHVRSKARWIAEKQLEYSRYQPRAGRHRLYVNASLHPYLGRKYRLRLSKATQWSLVLKSGTFQLAGPETGNVSAIHRVFQDWYMRRAHLVFAEQLDRAVARFGSRAVAPTIVTVRKMERRWGSMTPGGRLILNPRLIEHAKPAIEYVITHELAHRLVPDHSARFWSALRKAMPDWQGRKNLLEERLS